jgi:hypothetical protein
MKSIRYLAPTGMLGSGFVEQYFNAAAASNIDFIACDSGSIDGGPANLGADKPIFTRAAIKRDLTHIIRAGHRHRIPVLIGSAGGSGNNWGVRWTAEIAHEIVEELGIDRRIATITAEPDRDSLIEKLRQGRITALSNAPTISEQKIRTAERIVAMMGPEPFIAALQQGADIVIAGRSSDAALMAAIPISRGIPAGLAWHAGKVMECGGSAVAQMSNIDGMICTLTEDYFELEPTNPDHYCSPVSIASHSLYETADPVTMYEPGGTMRLGDVTFTAASERAVRVTGSMFERAEQYTVKIEGAELLGYKTAIIGGITDPVILDRLDSFLDDARKATDASIARIQDKDLAEGFDLYYRVYGRNAVTPSVNVTPGAPPPHEVGVLITAVAKTQQAATTVAAQAGFAVLHVAVPEWHGLVSNLAFPFSPHLLELGAAHNFMFNHVVEIDDPLEFFTIQLEESTAERPIIASL